MSASVQFCTYLIPARAPTSDSTNSSCLKSSIFGHQWSIVEEHYQQWNKRQGIIIDTTNNQSLDLPHAELLSVEQKRTIMVMWSCELDGFC
jgi:hypothetical protein